MDVVSPRAKLDALTGLRFLAAAMIVVHHARALHVPVPSYAFDHGVSLFFVLSGFILAYVYPKLESFTSIKNFLLLRFARIWPAHAVTLLLAVFLTVPTIDARFFANLAMVHGWVPSSPWYFSYNAPSWSISTEFFFYLAFPVLIWQWSRTFWWKWLFAGSLVVLLCVIGRRLELPSYTSTDRITLHGLLYISPLARLLEFVTGMVAYSAFAWLQPKVAKPGAGHKGIRTMGWTIVEIGAVALVVYCLLYWPVLHFVMSGLDAKVEREWLTHTASFAAFPPLIVVLALGAGWVSRLLRTRVAVLLGEISFSVYLLHQVVFNVYARDWLAAGNQPDYFGLVVCVSFTLIGALLLWAAIEVPCRSWMRQRLAGSEPVKTLGSPSQKRLRAS